MKRFFKKFIAGIVGADIFLTLGILVFALVKLFYILSKKDLLISKYNIVITIAIVLLLGFTYGIRSYVKKNNNSKIFKLNKINFFLTLMIALVFSLATYIILKEGFNNDIGVKSVLGMTLLLIMLMYPFSALISTYLIHKKNKKSAKQKILVVIFNPIFIMIYFWLFIIIVYNSIYVPCGVMILGVDHNKYTSSTKNLDIPAGRLLISIDNTQITSLNDVKNYINGLESTKEVFVETEDNIYYIKTYVNGNTKYMGLLLKQVYCERKY